MHLASGVSVAVVAALAMRLLRRARGRAVRGRGDAKFGQGEGGAWPYALFKAVEKHSVLGVVLLCLFILQFALFQILVVEEGVFYVLAQCLFKSYAPLDDYVRDARRQPLSNVSGALALARALSGPGAGSGWRGGWHGFLSRDYPTGILFFPSPPRTPLPPACPFHPSMVDLGYLRIAVAEFAVLGGLLGSGRQGHAAQLHAHLRLAAEPLPNISHARAGSRGQEGRVHQALARILQRGGHDSGGGRRQGRAHVSARCPHQDRPRRLHQLVACVYVHYCRTSCMCVCLLLQDLLLNQPKLETVNRKLVSMVAFHSPSP
jgi:hypothetical protein